MKIKKACVLLYARFLQFPEMHFCIAFHDLNFTMENRPII